MQNQTSHTTVMEGNINGWITQPLNWILHSLEQVNYKQILWKWKCDSVLNLVQQSDQSDPVSLFPKHLHNDNEYLKPVLENYFALLLNTNLFDIGLIYMNFPLPNVCKAAYLWFAAMS